MSEMDKFKELYNRVVNNIVDLHNSHLRFMRAPRNYEYGLEVRNASRKMVKDSTELYRQCRLVYAEAKAAKKADIERRKQEAAYRKLHPKKTGRPKGKKNEQHNSTTTKTL